jgi:MFS transporter, ACS family, hexuronate transporter
LTSVAVNPAAKKQGLLSINPERYRWSVLALVWLAHLIYYFIYSSVGVLGPVLKADMELTNTEFGILISAIGVGTTVVQIPGGIWCDKFGVRAVMTVAFVLMAVSAFIFSMSTGFVISCIVLLSLGLAVGCMQISAVKAIVDWFPFSGRATALGIKQTGVNVGGVAGSLALPLVMGFCGWHLIYKGMGLLALFYALYFLALYRNTVDTKGGYVHRSHQSGLFKEAIHSLKQVHFVIVTVAGLFLIIVQFAFSSYVVLYLNRSLSHSLELSGTILALSFAVGALGRVGWGICSDYFFRDRETGLAVIGAIGAAVCVALGFITPLTPVWILYLLSVFSGLSLMGWMGIWMALVGELSRGKSTGLGIGLSFFFANIGLLVGPPSFGFLTDLTHSYFIAWLFLAFCMGLVSLLMLVGMYASRRAIHEEPNTV